ncbi:Hsp70 family protein [Treponema sp.]|uniref:Hsp70 family protein n=1 Tax=Treponema sp. TaxID=166 RepID=UPI00388D2F1F
MKTIGIKLADGTFYPILEEGTPKKRMLDLTTAKDNQTKVQIDLYRSENGTMEDAEYVDTLEVTKLNPHPNGEPELHLSVGLDEENHLTAEVVDPETGKKSETEVTLVSRTLAEREETPDLGVADAAVAEEAIAENAGDATFSPDELPDMGTTALEDMPFSFDHSEPASSEESTADSADEFAGALPDFSDLDNDIPVEDTTLESVNFDSNSLTDDTNEDVIGTESPDLNFDGLDFDAPASSETVSDDSTFSTDDLPDFSSDFDSESSSSDTEATGLNFDDLNDPAFDSTEFDSTIDSLNSEPEDKFFDDINTSSAASGSAMDFSDLYDKETIAGEHASLYDEDEEDKKTRTPVIICIICAIICVIATILLLFVVPSKYNLLASRNTNGVSLLDRFFSKEKETVIEKETATPAQLEEPQEETKFIDVVVEEPKEEAPAAQEDKIVIAPEPEKVVPEPAPVVEEKKPEVKKSADVKYHIRWGDTLWDISESYYKTPWKYPKIADYNRIKNPDLIISGSDILIPAE